MTYDIHLVRVRPGSTVEETLDQINAGFDPDSDPPRFRPTDGQRGAQRHLT